MTKEELIDKRIEELADRKIEEARSSMWRLLTDATDAMRSGAEDVWNENDVYQKFRVFSEKMTNLKSYLVMLRCHSRNIRAIINVKTMLKGQEKEDGEK